MHLEADVDITANGYVMNYVTQIIYVSRATAYVDKTELYELTQVSGSNNKKAEVTGALVFCNGYFLQVLEGASAMLDTLLTKIERDPRHCDVQIISKQSRPRRLFQDWTMACLHESSMSPQQLACYQSWIQLLDNNDGTNVDKNAHELLTELRLAIDHEIHVSHPVNIKKMAG
jgi:hypothetical protein